MAGTDRSTLCFEMYTAKRTSNICEIMSGLMGRNLNFLLEEKLFKTYSGDVSRPGRQGNCGCWKGQLVYGCLGVLVSSYEELAITN